MKRNKRNQRRNQPSQRKPGTFQANQPPPYTPDRVLTYKIRYVPVTANYLWQLPVGVLSPFGFASSTTNIYSMCKYVRLASVRMTLLYDPDESLDTNFISMRWAASAGQNGILGSEKLQYASAAQPAVIEESFRDDDPRGYFYDITTASGNPTLVMQTRKNCFIDITWQVILHDGLMDTNVTTGATAGWLYTNNWSTDLTCPGRISITWF